MSDDFRADRYTLGRLAIGGKTSGNLNFNGDRDWFKVSLVKGQKYQFDVIEYNAMDAYLYLRNSYGSYITYDNNSGSGDDPRITYTATSTGTYFLDVGDVGNNNSGSYQLQVKQIASDISGYSRITGFGSANAEKAFERYLGIDLISRPNDGGYKWNLDNIGAKEVWMGSGNFLGATGKGVIVAVIDTGIDSDHHEFKGRIIKPWDFVNNNNDAEDDDGHGTHVAGTIAAANDNRAVTGVAYDAKIMPLDVFHQTWNPNKQKYEPRARRDRVEKAIRYAVDNGADVINMSLGGEISYQPYLNALKYAHDKNVVVVMAAGNNAKSSPGYPAAYASQYGIAVGAETKSKNFDYRYSNKAGTTIMNYATAPGTKIASTDIGRYSYRNGTSMAAPHVAGIAALLKSHNKNFTSTEIINLITGKSDKTTNNSYSSLDLTTKTTLPGEDLSSDDDTEIINGTSNNDVLNGSDKDNNINGFAGNDTITGNNGFDIIDGGDGDDLAIYTGNFKDYSISRLTSNNDLQLNSEQINITDNRTSVNDGIDIIKNIEKIQFADQTIKVSNIDKVNFYTNKFSDYKFNHNNGNYEIVTEDGVDNITGIPTIIFADKEISAIADIKGTFDLVTEKDNVTGRMFRLYNAAFNRFPDTSGLKYWITKNASGENSDRVVAQSFLGSVEFMNLYGENITNTEYINNMYTNVLGRLPDSSGLNYWVGQLNNGIETRYEVLLGFAESAENKATFTEMTGLA